MSTYSIRFNQPWSFNKAGWSWQFEANVNYRVPPTPQEVAQKALEQRVAVKVMPNPEIKAVFDDAKKEAAKELEVLDRVVKKRGRPRKVKDDLVGG